MCGIAGIVNKHKACMGLSIQKMLAALEHRGPDGWGYAELNPGESLEALPSESPGTEASRVWLGHRRLSIIDLEGSKQPLRNEDGTVWVVFNGEIYNYLELRIALSGRGHALREAGDTEVLVHLWEEYGSRMLEHLRGMFAFAIYDTRSDTLFMARDRFGQKPLYYWQNEDFLAFASELQAFWALDDFPGTELNNTSVCRYFRYGYVPGPRTIYKTVKSLPPGHSLTIRNSAWKTEQYWRPRVEGCDDGCIQDRLEELLDEATRIRLRSDVPLGAFLSGGVDSALVVASMTRQMQTPVETFTITSDKAGFDESGHARRTSNHLGTMHHEFQVDPDLVAVSEGLARHFGQPFADYSCVPTYYVSRETRKHVTVALSGDGGDELFAGYQRYKHYRWSRLAGRIPWRTRRLLAGILWKWGNSRSFPGGGVGDFLLSAGGVDVKGENHSASYHHFWREQCFQPGFYNHMIETEDDDIAQFKRLYNEAASDDPLEKWLEVDQRMYLAEDILTKVDISSMAVSLECRSPFLDHLLAEAANRIPARTKLRFGRTKIPLRNLAAKRLPKDIGKLPKKGFSLPLGIWFRYDLKDWAYETLFGHQSAWEAFMRPESVRWLWQEHQSSRNDHSMRLWIIISWILWWNAMREGTRK